MHTFSFVLCAVNVCGFWQMYSLMYLPFPYHIEQFHHPQIIPRASLISSFPFPNLATTHLTTSYSFTFSRMSCKCNHIVYSLFSHKSHANTWMNTFYSINVPISLLIYSQTEGHLHCLQFLVVINKAAMDIYIQILGDINFQIIWVNT